MTRQRAWLRRAQLGGQFNAWRLAVAALAVTSLAFTLGSIVGTFTDNRIGARASQADAIARL